MILVWRMRRFDQESKSANRQHGIERTRQLRPLTFAVIASGRTVCINRLQMRKAKHCTLSHSILYPNAVALEIGICHPHALRWCDIDHHDRAATLVSDEIAWTRPHLSLPIKPFLEAKYTRQLFGAVNSLIQNIRKRAASAWVKSGPPVLPANADIVGPPAQVGMANSRLERRETRVIRAWQ
jgi:hypothetical protein